MGYSKDAIKGVSWITLYRVLTRGITFIRLAILGRLLNPIQFGYFGIATLVLSFLEILTETGVNVFIIQEKNQIKDHLNSAWLVSIIRGIILALLIYLLAPLISQFFNAKEAYSTIILISLVPFIRGFINPAIIIYQKDLLFNKEFKLRTTLFLIDAMITIIVAYFTKNATSFAFGLIASAILELIMSYYIIRPWPEFKFELHKIKHIFRHGKWVTLTGIFSYFADNGDNIAVGKLLGSDTLGIYQVAYKFSTLPISEITNVVNQVIFPVYSKFSNDKKRLLRAFMQVTLISSLAAILLGFIIYIFAKELITFTMGKQWLNAVAPIQILAIYGILRAIFGNFAPLFLSIKKQNYVAQMTFFRVLILLTTVIPLILYYGIVGAGYAMLLSIFVEIPVILYFFYKIFKK